MSGCLKFIGGVTLGAIIGAGLYLIITQDDSEEGLVHELKVGVNRALEEGKRAAQEQRRLLEQELGFSLSDEQSAPPTPFRPS